MKSNESFTKVEDFIHGNNNNGATLVILIDSDPLRLAEKYAGIKTDHRVINSYSINGKHCISILVSGKVLIKRRNK